MGIYDWVDEAMSLLFGFGKIYRVGIALCGGLIMFANRKRLSLHISRVLHLLFEAPYR